MEKYAFFDVDKTIYKGYSEDALIEYIDKNNIFGQKPLKEIRRLNKLYRDRKLSYNESAEKVSKRIVKMVENQSIEAVDEVIDEVLKMNEEKFQEWFLPTYKFLKDNGFKSYLVSGATEMTIKTIAEYIDPELEYYCTKLDIKDGRYTGNFIKHMNGSYKREVVESIENQQDDVLTIAFGDSPGDIPMLEAVDYAFVFTQIDHPEMEELVSDKGWFMFKDQKELMSELTQII
jgi:HAD superfamily phosphoserine phosphatase-like hydrolase